MRRILSLLVLTAFLATFTMSAMAARRPPTLKKMTKPPICKNALKVGESYNGKTGRCR